eukprot:9470856-Pyramimonas_sp.AAC.1
MSVTMFDAASSKASAPVSSRCPIGRGRYGFVLVKTNITVVARSIPQSGRAIRISIELIFPKHLLNTLDAIVNGVL